MEFFVPQGFLQPDAKCVYTWAVPSRLVYLDEGLYPKQCGSINQRSAEKLPAPAGVDPFFFFDNMG